MQQHSQQPSTPQQAAIQEVRERYARGELSFEVFKRGLDALVLAHTADECRAILAALPSLPHAAPLHALETSAPAAPTPAVSTPPAARPRTAWMFMLLGELKRTRKRWRLGERTTCVSLIGETKLDLSLATLPRSGVLRIVAAIGEATIYVPRSVSVSVRAFTLLGEAKALGEHSSGIPALLHAESHDPEDAARAESHIEIQAFMLLGELNIVQVDAPALTAPATPSQGLLARPR
jgi:hypothetical protein